MLRTKSWNKAQISAQTVSMLTGYDLGTGSQSETHGQGALKLATAESASVCAVLTSGSAQLYTPLSNRSTAQSGGALNTLSAYAAMIFKMALRKSWLQCQSVDASTRSGCIDITCVFSNHII